MLENKPCKICGGKRFANTSWCLECYKKREAAKREGKKLKKKKPASLKELSRNLEKLFYIKTWKLMSELVRRKKVDWKGYTKCYTCGKSKHWKEMDAGHRWHNKLDFDERNIKTQCKNCNQFEGGSLKKYEERLVEDNGEEWAEKLKRDASTHGGYSQEEVKQHHDRLKKELSELI